MDLNDIMAGSAAAILFGMLLEFPLLVYVGVGGIALTGIGMFIKAMGWA